MIAEKSVSDFPMPLSVINAGHYHQDAGCEPEWCYIEAGVELAELVTSGRGWVRVDGNWEEVTVGALVWHVEGDQTVARSDWDDPYRCLAVRFECAPGTVGRRAPHLTWWNDAEEVRKFTREVVAARADDQFDGRALLSYVYGRLLFQARLWERTGGRAQLPGKVQLALDLIEADRLPLREVAARVGWSVAHLHDVFRSRLGVTPHEVALRRRMRIARERLAATDLPVKQIADECGFATAAAFCHAFKARVGLTPLAYRQQESGLVAGIRA